MALIFWFYRNRSDWGGSPGKLIWTVGINADGVHSNVRTLFLCVGIVYKRG